MLDFLLITLVILLVTQWFQMKPFFWRKAGIPYSLPVPIFGSTFGTFVKPFHQVWKEMYMSIGDNPMYGFHFFGVPGLIIGDPNVVKKFTVTDGDSFMSHGFHTNDKQDPLSRGLFFSDGEQWKVFRGKMTPFFTPGRIKSMMPLVEPISENFVRYVTYKGKTGPVEMHDASMKFTISVIMSTVFGLEPDPFDNPESFFSALQKELLSFSFGVKSMFGVLNPSLYNSLGLTVLSKSTTEKLNKFVCDVVNQRLDGVGNRPDFVQGMIDLMQKENPEDDQITYNADGTIKARFDRFSITGQCMLMYVAGTETTGNTMGFVFYELARNPEVQETARQEIIAMIQRTKGAYNYEDLHELEYVHMVIKEALRMYPVATMYARKCTKKFDFNGVEIPVGGMVVITPIGIHHDPRYYPEPDKFIPERFSDESNITPGTYVPFGMGPRTCIGMKFALTEIALCLCKLLPKCKLTFSNRTEIPLKFSSNPTLSPKNGVWLNVEEIN